MKHQFFDFLRLVGMRDRLRCPRCRKVGTWKPHGGWLDREDLRKVRRWMCKWCGLYRGPEGELQALCDPDAGAWQLTKDAGPNSYLPANVIQADPWRG